MNQTQKIETAESSTHEYKYTPPKKYRIKENSLLNPKIISNWRLQKVDHLITISSDDIFIMAKIDEGFELSTDGEIKFGGSYIKNKILVKAIIEVSEEFAD